jgi:hypothetical protein
MPEVLTVFVQTEAPKGEFKGRVVEGCYTVDASVLTLTNRHGEPVRDAEGYTYTQKLNAGDNPKQIAGILTKKFAKARRGKNATPKGFGGPIHYPKSWNSLA